MQVGITVVDERADWHSPRSSANAKPLIEDWQPKPASASRISRPVRFGSALAEFAIASRAGNRPWQYGFTRPAYAREVSMEPNSDQHRPLAQ
jgi:hypothetical protein